MLTQEQIKDMQSRLNKAGYQCSTSGILTANTRRALKEYYADQGIPMPDVEAMSEVPLIASKPQQQ